MKVESVPGKSVAAAATATNAKTDLTQNLIRPLRNCKDLQEILKVSPRKLWELYSSGQIPCVRLGRAVRFRDEDIQNFIASGGAA